MQKNICHAYKGGYQTCCMLAENCSLAIENRVIKICFKTFGFSTGGCGKREVGIPLNVYFRFGDGVTYNLFLKVMAATCRFHSTLIFDDGCTM